MGFAEIALIASAGVGLLGAQQSAQAAREQAEAEQDEIHRQQVEATRKSQADKSERALAADKEFASMLVAMETIGGAGSLNEARLGREIAGTAGLDLARIEGNRDRQVQSLQASARAAHKRGVAGQVGAATSAIGTIVDLGSGIATQQASKERNKVLEEIARGRPATPPAGANTASPLGGASFT